MSSFLASFDRELIIHIDAAALRGITPHARAEMDSFIASELHRPEMFGPRTFISIREADFNQFEIRHYGRINTFVLLPSIDISAWEAVCDAISNAHLASRA